MVFFLRVELPYWLAQETPIIRRAKKKPFFDGAPCIYSITIFDYLENIPYNLAIGPSNEKVARGWVKNGVKS